MSEDKPKGPFGVLAIMTRDDGHVVATVADFERQGYGGFKLWEAQKIRARDAVKWKAVRAYCSDFIVNALDNYAAEQVANRLISHGGHRITCRAIGWDGDAAEAIERS